MSQYILVKNAKNRSVQGFRPYQIGEILLDNLEYYKTLGFEVVRGAEQNDIIIDDDIADLDDRIAFLTSQGVVVGGNRKPTTIKKKSDELGYELLDNKDVDEDDLSELDDLVNTL